MKATTTILITGASGAIGSALAEAYAAPGVVLHLHGRNGPLLAEAAQRCKARGAVVEQHRIDLRDTAAVIRWLAQLGAASPIDLLVANAGMNTHVGPGGEAEPWAEVEALLDVNLRATMALVHAVLPSMRQRGSGQFAGSVLRIADDARLLCQQGGNQDLRRGAARLACAGGHPGQRGDARLRRIADVCGDARAEAVPLVARTRGADDSAWP